MVHGTLLFGSDLYALSRALSPPENRLITKAVQSVRHPVANIRQLLPRSMDLSSFANRLLILLGNQVGDMQKLSHDHKQWREIHRLAADKYRSWGWTFGRTPDFSVVKNGYGKERLRIDVHRGKIAEIVDLDPDNSSGIWRELGKKLSGTRYDWSEIRRTLDGIRISAGNRILNSMLLASAICSN